MSSTPPTATAPSSPHRAGLAGYMTGPAQLAGRLLLDPARRRRHPRRRHPGHRPGPHLAPEEYRVTPHLPWHSDGVARPEPRRTPPLLRGYLRLGAWVCGEPAHDVDSASPTSTSCSRCAAPTRATCATSSRSPRGMSVWLPTAPCTPGACAGHAARRPAAGVRRRGAAGRRGRRLSSSGPVAAPPRRLLAPGPGAALVRPGPSSVLRAFGIRVRISGGAGPGRRTASSSPTTSPGSTSRCRRRPARPDARQGRGRPLAGVGTLAAGGTLFIDRDRSGPCPAPSPTIAGALLRRRPGDRLPRGLHLVRPGPGPLPPRRLPGRAGRRGARPARPPRYLSPAPGAARLRRGRSADRLALADRPRPPGTREIRRAAAPIPRAAAPGRPLPGPRRSARRRQRQREPARRIRPPAGQLQARRRSSSRTPS